MLDLYVRQRVLGELGDVGRIRELLEKVGQRPDDTVQRVFESYLFGTAAPLEEQTLSELTATHLAVTWLAGIVEGAPTVAQVREQVALATFLKPFRDLVGDNFQGRRRELDVLSDYVGVRRASSGTEWIWRGLREVFSFHEKPPLMTHGAGGMGKSTLLAKFILEHASSQEKGKVPFVYVDFDRPAMSAAEPLTLLFEALRQLAVQFPHARNSLMGLRSSWEEKFVEEIRRSRGTRDADSKAALHWGSVPRVTSKMRERMLHEFSSILRIIEQQDRPLLFLLDTVEEVQYRGRPLVKELWSFLNKLQELHPRLRVVLSGRVPIHEGFGETEKEQRAAESEFKTEPLQLTGLDRDSARRYMEGDEIPSRVAKVIARHITHKRDGVSPLSLGVAVAVWRKQRKSKGDEPDERFWAELKVGRIQTELISRYLDHVHDKELKPLAYPGFVLRRVTPELVLDVLAQPCGIKVDNVEQAAELLKRLGQEIAQVQSVYGDERELRPRPEVRRLVLDLMLDLEPKKVESIHQAAVEHYKKQSDQALHGTDNWIAARAEEIYHRILLKQDEVLIQGRWDPILSDALSGTVLEFDKEQQALLDVLSGKTVSEALRRKLSQSAWERDAARRAEAHFELGNLEAARAVLAERSNRKPGSPLYNLEGRVLAKLNDWTTLRDRMKACIDSFEPDSSSTLRVEVLALTAEAEAQLGQPGAALEKLDEAAALARTREDKLQRLEIAIRRLSTLKIAGAEEEQIEAQRAIVERVEAAGEAKLREQSDLVFQAAELLGSDYPTVLVWAIRLGVLQGLTSEGARHLGRALGSFDAEESEKSKDPPGWVATRAGLQMRGSATETWKKFLTESPTLAADVLPRVFEEFPPAPEHPIWWEIAQCIRDIRAPETADESEEPVSRGAGPTSFKRLTGRQRVNLDHAITNAFNLQQLRELLDFRLDRSLDSLVLTHGAFREVVLQLIQVAHQEGWLEDFILAVRDARPDNPELYELARELGLGTSRIDEGDFERVFGSEQGTLDVSSWRARLGAIENQVCLVEITGERRSNVGTGFLVSPQLLLTAHHVLAPVIDGQTSPDDVTFRFDHKASPDGRVLHRGTLFRLASQDWLVDYLPHSEAGETDQEPSTHDLDFALLRLAGYPGDEPVGGAATSSGAPGRGWIEIPPDPPELIPGTPLLVVHHPHGEPLKVTMDTKGVVRLAENRSRVWYGSETRPGSGGAPVFNNNFELVALHEGSWNGLAFGVPIATIMRRLTDLGHLGGIGTALA